MKNSRIRDANGNWTRNQKIEEFLKKKEIERHKKKQGVSGDWDFLDNN